MCRTLPVTLALALQAASPVLAADPTPALTAVNAAIDAVKKDSAPCKSAALTPLKDARDALTAAGRYAAPEALTKARRAVEDTADTVGGICAAVVVTQLSTALEQLQIALGEKQPAAPVIADEVKNCWNFVNTWTAVDPGCAFKKNKRGPANKLQFDKIMAALKQTSDRFEQTSYLERIFSERTYVTSMQLGLILARLASEVDRVGAAKQAASYVVDPQNASTLGRLFSNPAQRQDALDAFAQARAGQ